MRLTVDIVDQFIFDGFINEILDNIETHPVPGDYDSNKIILWDNLCVHKPPFVAHIIEYREIGHIRIGRLPAIYTNACTY